MARVLKLLLTAALVAALVGPAWSQVSLPPPLPPGVTPAWTPVPGAPRVAYAPNIPANLFLFKGKYFYLLQGQWYRGQTPMGPWHALKKLPPALVRMNPAVFKQ